MIVQCLFTTLSILFCSASVHPMGLLGDGYNADKPGIAETTNSFEAPFLELLQEMLIGYSTNY